MFRMWGKLWKDNHLLRDTVAANGDYSMSRTAMVFQALDEICREFDLGQPIWLDSNIKDFKLHDKTGSQGTASSRRSILITWRSM